MLNKACPKDCYSLSRIGQLEDSTCGHALLIFMDAFSRYHHISLIKSDRSKAAFIIDTWVFMGFMVNKRGIDTNPDKIKSISELPEPKSIRDIQKLTGRMAASTKFVSKSAEKALPSLVE